MKKTRRLSIILLSLSVAAAVAAANPPVLQGPAFLPGDGTHDEAAGNQEEVAIAAGGGGFLTAWTDMRTAIDFQGLDQTGHDVYAARLDAAGNLIDTVPLILSRDAGAQEDSEVAWNGQNWLVIWEHETPVPGQALKTKIFGARVAPDDLRANGSIGAAQCGWEDNPGTNLTETSDPPPGVGYYYVIRGDAPQMTAGTLDNAPGLTTPEGRDQEVGTAGGFSCEDMP